MSKSKIIRKKYNGADKELVSLVSFLNAQKLTNDSIDYLMDKIYDWEDYGGVSYDEQECKLQAMLYKGLPNN